MSETEKKQPKCFWRFLFLACAVYGALQLLPGLVINIFYWILKIRTVSVFPEEASLGIIGGADGPTAIFVAAPVWTSYLIPVALLIVGIWGFLGFGGCKKK